MAMNLRLDPQLDQALTETAACEQLSKQQVVVRAIQEYTSRQRALRDQTLTRIVTEDAALLARLAQ
jgi:predicted transcriptional regulator